MTNRKSTQETYTKFPNRYNDTIRPRLSDTQRDVCDIVIRMTYGWHRTSARISNAIFMSKSGKSEPAIIKAKKQLEEIGLLVILEKGGGSKAGLYMLDLHYDNPEKSARATMKRQREQLEILKAQESTTDQIEPSLLPEQTVINEIVESQSDFSMELSENEPKPSLDIQAQESPILQTGIFDTISESNSIKTEDSEASTTKLDLALYNSSSDPSNEKKKQTIHSNPNKESDSKKKDIKSVCFEFLKFFPETKSESDWSFFGWAVKSYGLETCLDKLNYMKEHRKRHEINNPKGFFRFSLEKDYKPPKFIAEKIKADKRAELSYQKTQDMIADMEATKANINYEAGLVAMRNIMDILNDLDKGLPPFCRCKSRH